LSTKHVHLSFDRGRTRFRWVRVLFAACILSAWMAVAMTGGVAHADTPASDGQTTSDTKPAAQDTGSSGTPASPKSRTPKRPGGLHEHQVRARASESEDHRTQPGTRKAAEDVAPDVEGMGETATPPRVLKSEPTNASRVARRGDRPLDSTGAAVKPLKPLKSTSLASTRPPADVTAMRRPPPPQPLSSVQSQDPTPLAATIASVGQDTPVTAVGSGAADLPQLARQGTGLLSDVGVVVASAVYTVADTFARAFGPNDFLGVPYALATALANTAAAAVLAPDTAEKPATA